MKPTLLHPLWSGATLLALAVVPAQSPTAQSPTQAPFASRPTMQAVARLLERAHVSQRPLDREISRRAFAALVRELDPLGLYFLQGDLDALADERDELGAELRAGDDHFAMRVQRLYERRVEAGIESGLQWLQRPHDFEVDETMPIDVGLDGYAATQAQLDDRWRRRVKYDLLVLEGDGVKGAAAAAKLQARYERMAERVTLREPEAIDSGFIEAIASSYDPHTSYLPPRVAEDFAIQMRLNYEGIGAVLRDEDGRAVVSRLIDGGAAAASGQLKVGDVIQGVGQGNDGPIAAVHGLDLDEVVDQIRGPRGSSVRLSVTTGAEPPRTVVLQRQRTELADSRASGKVVQQDGVGIGWIDLPGFYADPHGAHSASRDTAALLDGFREQHVACVVLDLRWNGGGLLSEAVALTGLFLDTGNVVQVRDADGAIAPIDDLDPGAAWTGPLVVLDSRFSASASEIVAGAIVDQGRGIVVGDTSTHGKGTVQTMIDLAHLAGGDTGASGALKLTVQQFFRPGGDSTQLRGVPSDIVLPSRSQSIARPESTLPQALPFRRIAAVVDVHSPRRDPRLLARLAAASAQRVAADPKFQQVVAENARRAHWLEDKVVPLQRAGFEAYRGAQHELRDDGTRAADDPWYVAEVGHIARDYAAALDARTAQRERAMAGHGGVR